MAWLLGALRGPVWNILRGGLLTWLMDRALTIPADQVGEVARRFSLSVDQVRLLEIYYKDRVRQAVESFRP